MCVATVFRFIYDRGDGVISIDVPYEFWLCVTSLQWMKELNEKKHTINYYYLFTEFCELVYFMFDWSEPMERRRKRTTLWLTFWKQHLYTFCSACGDNICVHRRQQIYSENKKHPLWSLPWSSIDCWGNGQITHCRSEGQIHVVVVASNIVSSIIA